MEEKTRDATKLYIPIITVVGMLSGLLVIIWFAATKNTIIESQAIDIKDLQAEMKNVPTRQEYNDLKSSIAEVKNAIDNLGKEIRAKN